MKRKFVVEIDTLFQTEYAKSYEVAGEITKALSEAAAELPFFRQVVVTPWDEA